jgi:outer membrane murein-binding lipoprotein Lpp
MAAQATQEEPRLASTQALEAKVEQLAEEVDDLVRQHLDATSQIKRAEQQFTRLDNLRKELAPRPLQETRRLESNLRV